MPLAKPTAEQYERFLKLRYARTQLQRVSKESLYAIKNLRAAGMETEASKLEDLRAEIEVKIGDSTYNEIYAMRQKLDLP